MHAKWRSALVASALLVLATARVEAQHKSNVALDMGTPLPIALLWKLNESVAIRPDFNFVRVDQGGGNDQWHFGIGASALFTARQTGSLTTYADLTSLSRNAWNEIVVDGRGNAYVNTADAIALVTPGGSARQVADGGAFPNGMAVTPDNSTLIMAESHGRKLTAFEIATDGSLSNRRVWADLGDGVPDGICLDAEKAVWYADVPNKRCVRVREGGEVLQTIALDRGCFSCALGGVNRKTLFVIATEWRGMEKVDEVARARAGQVLSIEVATPGV